jgi:hypothetical protein
MAMSTSHQGIDNHNGEMQPSDKDHAQTAHKTSPDKSASHESTRELRVPADRDHRFQTIVITHSRAS